MVYSRTVFGAGNIGLNCREYYYVNFVIARGFVNWGQGGSIYRISVDIVCRVTLFHNFAFAVSGWYWSWRIFFYDCHPQVSARVILCIS